MEYPRGLIRYSTENAVKQHFGRQEIIRRALRPRTIVYASIFFILCAATAWSLATRVPLKVDVLRDRAALAREAEEGIRALTEEDSGRLRFTCPVSTGDRMVSELLARFAELCPGVQVELNFTNAMIDMSQGENDIALRAMELIPDNLVALPLGRLKDVVVASPALLAREGIPATPYELGGRSCLLQGHNPDWEQWHFRQGEEEAHILVQGRVRANHYSTLLQLARAGMGFAKCPLMLVEASLARGELVAVLTEWQTGLHPIHVLHAQQRRVPSKIRLFKQVLAQWFAERPHYLLG
jgi:DNA-binding transcriptional LysR family regulator/preprotein translocase subunit Sec61beta